jgi:hypothetical protein
MPAPPVIEFDADGHVVNSWGNPDSMAKTRHGCFIDRDGNFWTAGNNDGIVQKYTHDGSTMLLQIGTKGVMDSADGLHRQGFECEPHVALQTHASRDRPEQRRRVRFRWLRQQTRRSV